MRKLLIIIFMISLMLFACDQFDATVVASMKEDNSGGNTDYGYEVNIVKNIFIVNNKPLPLNFSSTYNKDVDGRVVGLYLDKYDLSILPDNIGQLSHLKYIYAEHNKIFYLPLTIGNLKELETIDLKGNLLRGVPKTIKNCKKLKNVNFNSNLLADFPTALLELPELFQLRISDNLFSSLPADYSRLIKLKYLYLENNQLTSIPEGIGNTLNLTGIYLEGNQLYCENGVQNTSLIPVFLTNGSIPNVYGLYSQNCNM